MYPKPVKILHFGPIFCILVGFWLHSSQTLQSFQGQNQFFKKKRINLVSEGKFSSPPGSAITSRKFLVTCPEGSF